MLSKISDKLIQNAVKSKFIDPEQSEEYLYALNIILNIIISDITMLLIGLIMDMLWECIVFWLVYKILRKYCGGYHFETSLKCYLSACIMCPIVLASISFLPYNRLIWGTITIISSIILFVFSPVEAKNKSLDEKERQIFGKTARLFILLVTIFWFISSLVLHAVVLSKVLSLSIIGVMVFVMIGKASICEK